MTFWKYLGLTILGSFFTWAFTIFGSSLVVFAKKKDGILFNKILSFSVGIMLSSTFFSLLMPALNLTGGYSLLFRFILFLGVFLGGVFIFFCDRFFTSESKAKKIMLSIILHNIPEGMVVGIAFGSLFLKVPNLHLHDALFITFGIGIQNFPEGSAVSLQLKKLGHGRKKAFLYGALSGVVEPIFSIVGFLIVRKMSFLLPVLMLFASGSMLYVITEEIIPECQASFRKDFMTLFFLLGFTVMMVLDVFLA